MSAAVRVFVDGRGIDVAASATALDAVRAVDGGAADEVVAGRRAVTDSRGLPVDPQSAVAAGSIFRLVAARNRGAAADE